jgi:hypothetical protein
MNRTKRLLGGMLLVLLFGGAQACGDGLTAPETAESETVCVWINGVLHCFETD